MARRITDEVLETAAQLGAPAHDVGTILATVVIAAIELEAGNFASAEELLRTAEGAAQLNGQTGLRSLVSLGLARLATATCDQPAAFAHLTEARFVFDAPSPTVLASFAAEELRQALAFSPRHGQRLVSQLPNRTDARLLRVRLAIAQEDQKAAAELLDTIDARTTRERIEQATLRALTMADHNADAAHAHLREALLVARPQGFYRTILEQGFAVSGLLQSFPPDRALAPYLDDLITMADTALPPVRHSALPQFVDQLSPREITVLQYLPSRLTDTEIAAALYISANTLKTHKRNVYRKLGVTTRRQVVDIARAAKVI